jgi:hypothetical protein
MVAKEMKGGGMNKKVQVSYNGRIVPATQLEIECVEGEKWCQFKFSDGTAVITKVVIEAVSRVDGEYDENGNPVYLFRAANEMKFSYPKKLQRAN